MSKLSLVAVKNGGIVGEPECAYMRPIAAGQPVAPGILPEIHNAGAEPRAKRELPVREVSASYPEPRMYVEAFAEAER